MNLTLALPFALLTLVCGLVEGVSIIVKSIDGGLLKLVQLPRNWLVYHTESNAYIDFSVRERGGGLRYTCYPKGKIMTKMYPIYPVPTYSQVAIGWTLAIFPAKGAIDEGLDIAAWLEATGFQDHRSDLLYAWLEEREAREPFTVAVLFSLPKEIDSPNFRGANLERLLIHNIDNWDLLSSHEGGDLWDPSESDEGKRKIPVGSLLLYPKEQSTPHVLERSVRVANESHKG